MTRSAATAALRVASGGYDFLRRLPLRRSRKRRRRWEQARTPTPPLLLSYACRRVTGGFSAIGRRRLFNAGQVSRTRSYRSHSSCCLHPAEESHAGPALRRASALYAARAVADLPRSCLEMKRVRILFLGDIVGKPGRRAVTTLLPRLIDRERLDVVIANCENVADGAGVDPKSVRELLHAGVHLLTSGNHVWRKKEIVEFIADEPRLLRPANFPPGVPGRGWAVAETADGTPVAVVNLIGRVFMDSVDCPFRTIEALLPELRARARTVIVDMHAEATSEKAAMGWFLAGKVSAMLGSHTHVQTADERILSGGTAYITDVGMCGPTESVIGVQTELALRRFITHMPVKFEVARGPVIVQGAIVDVDAETGQARAIRRVRETAEP